MSPEHVRRVEHRDFLRGTASVMRDRGMSKGQILDVLEQRNLAYGTERLARFELLEIVDNALGAL